jgi:hypothetical protein
VQPGLREELVRRGRVFEGGRGVVGFEQVFNYGAGFEEGYGGVGVFDGGDAAVGVEGFEGFCFGVGVRGSSGPECVVLCCGEVECVGVADLCAGRRSP